MMGCEIVSRSEALRLGLDKYYTGNPCANGHIEPRYVDNYSCMGCKRDQAKSNYKTARELTMEEAKRIFRYEPETGKMWRVNDAISETLISSLNTHGYVIARVDSKPHLVHRLAYMLQGIDPSGFDVDHQDGNRQNNKWDNLRLVSKKENARNCKKYKSNSSGVLGVTKKGNKWRARICVDRIAKDLGTFPTIEEAAEARRKASIAFGFHTNHGRNTEASA